jgi:hypothetical protein
MAATSSGLVAGAGDAAGQQGAGGVAFLVAGVGDGQHRHLHRLERTVFVDFSTAH